MIYEGIDFANIEAHLGHCYLADDGQFLNLLLPPPDALEVRRRAVDCPLGVSGGFTQLLVGSLPDDVGEDGYKTRETERWLRGYAAAYDTNGLWLARGPAERELFPRRNYFNGGAHVQSAAGMQIVPACIAWLYRELAADAEAPRRIALANEARRGEGRIIEAHPRMFLYSAIERLHHINPNVISIAVLDHVAGYKENDNVGATHRRTIYRLLQQNPGWMGQVQREIRPSEPPQQLVDSDHSFDAWLAALTAWAHEHGETLDWVAAGLDPNRVTFEGHILVLSQ